MKILYDHQIFASQVYGGISRYFYELAHSLCSQYQDVRCLLSLIYSNNHYLKGGKTVFTHSGDYKRIIDYDNFCAGFNFKGKWKLFQIAKKISYIKDYSAANKACGVKAVEAGDYDIFHPTYYDNYFLKHIGHKPYVLTVYDMIHELFPHEFLRDESICYQKKILIENASKVIAISENTKKDIVKFYGCEEKIEVVHLGNSLMPPEANYAGGKAPPEKYILFVGSRQKYKNFDFFIKSAAPILKDHNDLKLVCAGGGLFSIDEINLLKSLGVAEKVTQMSLSDDGLALFYKNALAFIFPSLYEGFGIPVLESFASGCPLIVSNSSSLPEVAGDAAIYIDPQSAVSIQTAVEKAVTDKKLRDELQAKGFEQLKKFSWNITAQKTKKIYERILN